MNIDLYKFFDNISPSDLAKIRNKRQDTSTRDKVNFMQKIAEIDNLLNNYNIELAIRKTSFMTPFQKTISTLFPITIPRTAIWYDLDEIKNILNIIGTVKNSNHMFFPYGGGLDLKGADESFEHNCIELNTSYTEIISPKFLSFHSFDKDYDHEWSYFRIELNELRKTNIDTEAITHEELIEIAPLDYISLDQENNFDIEPSARHIVRRLKGRIVLFGKFSPYNKHRATYDARHNNLNDEEFRSYIEFVMASGWDK